MLKKSWAVVFILKGFSGLSLGDLNLVSGLSPVDSEVLSELVQIC